MKKGRRKKEKKKGEEGEGREKKMKGEVNVRGGFNNMGFFFSDSV